MKEITSAKQAIEACENSDGMNREELAELDSTIKKWYYDDNTTNEERWVFTKSGFAEMLYIAFRA